MSYFHIAIAFSLVCVCALLSWKKGHGQEKDLIISSVRAIIQLFILGYALTWIFAHNTLIVCLLISSLMTVNSAIHSRSRVKSRYKGLLLDNLFATVMAIWPLAFIGSLLLDQEPVQDPPALSVTARDPAHLASLEAHRVGNALAAP